MPNKASAKKRMKTSLKKQQANKAIKTKISSIRRQLRESVANGDTEKSEKGFREFCSVLDKAARKKIIKANNANRRKSRAAALLASCK
ncbi:MAG: 30S ribosomal protein S20 [Kiritimatiellae bacterium]|nr:30S ribosomal protein S20 [Kiritimatiellia bacterium]